MNDSLTSAIVGHLVGDYLLQSDWMAAKKKTDSSICFLHCSIWAGCVVFFSGWYLITPKEFGIVWIVLLATHFAQDRTQVIKFWMTKINRQPKFVEPPMAPWSIIVVDNVFHIVALWAVWKFLI